MSKEIFVPREIEETPPGILRIGVDLDENLVDLYTPARLLILKKLGINIDSGSSNFYIQQRPEIQATPGGSDFVVRIFKNSTLYQKAESIPDAVEVLSQWKQEEHQIWFITARPESLKDVTWSWLEDKHLGWAKERLLFRSSEDRVNFKAKKVAELGLHIFIEDHAETIRMCCSTFMMSKLVLNYPWNIDEDIGSQAVRVNNWQEIDEIVQNASRWHYFLHSR